MRDFFKLQPVKQPGSFVCPHKLIQLYKDLNEKGYKSL